MIKGLELEWTRILWEFQQEQFSPDLPLSVFHKQFKDT